MDRHWLVGPRARRAAARACTVLGGGAAPCFGKFEPLYAMKDIQEQCRAAAKQMTFKGKRTNFEKAVQYAAEQFRARFEAKAAEDAAENVVRLPCLVLLTDGSVSQGKTEAATILNSADAVVADAVSSPRVLVVVRGTRLWFER